MGRSMELFFCKYRDLFMFVQTQALFAFALGTRSVCRAVVSTCSGFPGLEAAGGAGTAAPGAGGTCAQRGSHLRRSRHGTGHQRGSWAAGEWCPQQQSCQQQRASSEATDPCSDAIKAARKPPASLPAGGEEKGVVGQEPGSGRKGAICQLMP